MQLPFFSNQEIWRQLYSEQVGFFTIKATGKIPDSPDLYAWDYPSKVADSLAQDIHSIKNVFNFDPMSCLHLGETHTHYMQWQAVSWSVQLSDEFQNSETMEDNWNALMEECDKIQRQAMNQIMLFNSLLSRPLYVGLALTSLSARYDQHASGTRKNSLVTRVSQYMSEANNKTCVDDLIFVALPLDVPSGRVLGGLQRDQFMLMRRVKRKSIGCAQFSTLTSLLWSTKI